MKKRNVVCAVLLLMIVSTAGCQSTNKEAGNMDADTRLEEENETNEVPNDTDDVSQENGQPPETENDFNDEEKIYNIEEYGTVEEKQQEFLDEATGEISYYYKMEQFYAEDTLPNAASINDTLQLIYDEYEALYFQNAENYQSGTDDEFGIPYAFWHILYITYVGDDYISILYNDIYYMGGAHPYSRLDGITIDCETGQQVFASQILEKDDEEILTEISNMMGLDIIGSWDDIDFYLTDSELVFFYRMPNFWEDVVLEKNNFI